MALALAAGVAVTACATLTRGTTQAASIITQRASGANGTLRSPAIGPKLVTTPATIVLENSQSSVMVPCTKPCFQPGSGVIASNAEAMAAGNIIAGGVIGLGIDAASCAINKYHSDNQIVMVPIPGCRA